MESRDGTSIVDDSSGSGEDSEEGDAVGELKGDRVRSSLFDSTLPSHLGGEPEEGSDDMGDTDRESTTQD